MKLVGALTSSAAFYVAMMVSGLVSVPLYLQAFGREPFGFWAALLGITSYLSLLNLGVAQAVSSGASKADRKDPIAVPRLVHRGFWVLARLCGFAIPAALLVALLCPWARWFDLDMSYDGPSRFAAAAVFVTFLIELPFSVFRAALYGSGEVATERLFGIMVMTLRLVLAWVFAYWHPSLWGGVVALSLANLSSPMFAMWVLKRRFPQLLMRLPDGLGDKSENSPTQGESFGRTSYDFFILQIAGAIVWSTDALLAGFVLGSAAAAHVSTAWRMLGIVLGLGSMIAPALAPMIAQLWAGGERARAARLAGEVAQMVFALMLAATLGAAFSGEAIFSLWLGDDMFSGRFVWLCYCAIVFVQALLIIPDAFITQAGRHRLYARTTMVEASLKLGLSVTLMHIFGLVGLPLGTLLGRCLTTLWVLPRAFGEAMDQRAAPWLAKVVAPSILPAVGFLLVFFGGRIFVGTVGSIATLALATLGGVVFLMVYALTGLPERFRSRFRLARSS